MRGTCLVSFYRFAFRVFKAPRLPRIGRGGWPARAARLAPCVLFTVTPWFEAAWIRRCVIRCFGACVCVGDRRRPCGPFLGVGVAVAAWISSSSPREHAAAVTTDRAARRPKLRAVARCSAEANVGAESDYLPLERFAAAAAAKTSAVPRRDF